jgi:hypothetical protein
VLSILDNYLGKSHHIYQDNFYSSVKLAKTLLDKNTKVCCTLRANRGIPRDLEKGAKDLKKGESSSGRKGDIMVHKSGKMHVKDLCE